MATRCFISLPDTDKVRASGEFAFTSQGADGFAGELQQALRETTLFERWRATQDDPDEVDPSLGATDPSAVVTGDMQHHEIRLVATTTLPGEVFKQRLRLLAGSRWELRDVRSA